MKVRSIVFAIVIVSLFFFSQKQFDYIHYSNNNCHHLILHLHFFLLIHNYNVEFFVIYHYYVIVNLANQRLGFTYKKKLIIKKFII